MKSTPLRVAGSSPHTRGAPDRFEDDPFGGGIIPAYAGSTASSTTPTRRGRDHPRIRGEHCPVMVRTMVVSGSSPHTRGARIPSIRRCLGWGIIPAYAGSTALRWSASGSARDHPRIRGEHGHQRRGEAGDLGSSPHTRGAPRVRHRSVGQVGIIPAYAGSTVRSTRTG